MSPSKDRGQPGYLFLFTESARSTAYLPLLTDHSGSNIVSTSRRGQSIASLSPPSTYHSKGRQDVLRDTESRYPPHPLTRSVSPQQIIPGTRFLFKRQRLSWLLSPLTESAGPTAYLSLPTDHSRINGAFTSRQRHSTASLSPPLTDHSNNWTQSRSEERRVQLIF